MIELPIQRLRPDAVLPQRAYGGDAGFDLARSHEMRLDHAYMVPILRLGLVDTPVIPLYINCNTPPLPSLSRCRDLGAG